MSSKLYIYSFKIENFKSIKDSTIFFHKDMSVLTGVNNCGKTTILEAIALWVECFDKLLHKASRGVKGKYLKGDYVFGTSGQYFNFQDIVSAVSPDFEDIFRNKNSKTKIHLTATLKNEQQESISIPFSIVNSTQSRYKIYLDNEPSFDYQKFKAFFSKLPTPVTSYFSIPLANIEPREIFVTTPSIQEKLKNRHSFEVMRNRLYALYHTNLFGDFQKDLSYILYGNQQNAIIKFYSRSDLQHDTRVVINYTIDKEPVEKDVALLGSGTLQAMEILLNVYNDVSDKYELNIILLDEPDSHIHRDIQNRLFEVLNKRSNNSNQIIMTTHNESMIRSTPYENLFHIDVKQTELKSINPLDLTENTIPHFKGFYPSAENEFIKTLDKDANGLDFISAIESNKIVFVEGTTDARLLQNIYRKDLSNRNKKIMFWVMGGVDAILDDVASYQKIFSLIKNSVSLWDKSLLVFDRDCMMDEHVSLLQHKLQKENKIQSYVADLYTQEAVLLQQLDVTADLLADKYALEEEKKSILLEYLNQECQTELKNLQGVEINAEFVERYLGRYINKMRKNYKKSSICDSDLVIAYKLKEYYATQPIHKLASKEVVERIINNSLKAAGEKPCFNIETDFYDLANRCSINNMFRVWADLLEFMSK